MKQRTPYSSVYPYKDNARAVPDSCLAFRVQPQNTSVQSRVFSSYPIIWKRPSKFSQTPWHHQRGGLSDGQDPNKHCQASRNVFLGRFLTSLTHHGLRSDPLEQEHSQAFLPKADDYLQITLGFPSIFCLLKAYCIHHNIFQSAF